MMSIDLRNSWFFIVNEGLGVRLGLYVFEFISLLLTLGVASR